MSLKREDPRGVVAAGGRRRPRSSRATPSCAGAARARELANVSGAASSAVSSAHTLGCVDQARDQGAGAAAGAGAGSSAAASAGDGVFGLFMIASFSACDSPPEKGEPFLRLPPAAPPGPMTLSLPCQPEMSTGTGGTLAPLLPCASFGMVTRETPICPRKGHQQTVRISALAGCEGDLKVQDVSDRYRRLICLPDGCHPRSRGR